MPAIVTCRWQPVSFAWFTPSFYAPGLGFLMFAVGVNLQLKAFATVFKNPKVCGCLRTCQDDRK